MTNKIEFKVGLFIIATVCLIIAAIGYTVYRKGFFERVETYTLASKTGEDLTEGMPVVFSGFTIGTVRTLELSEDGRVLIKIRVPERHVKWIRSDSRFIVSKPFIGSSRIIVLTDNLNSPALLEEEVPEVTKLSDIDETIKKLQPVIEEAKKITANIEKITANLADPNGDVQKILRNSEKITANLSSKESLLEMLIRDEQSVQAIYQTLGKTRDITSHADSILQKVDTMAAKTDEMIYGKEGTLPLVHKILQDLLVKLEKINAALDNVVKISADVSDSTTDIKLLRSEIDLAVNSINDLVKELNQKIPFKSKPEIKLP
ncbi:MAG: MlaD family protein [Syntrophales bacterium]